MPSTYTTSLRLTLPATGELAGTWGTTVNAGVTSLAEAAIAGTAAVTMIDADYTLTAVNGAADQARNMFVTLTGTLSTARNVICPPVSKLYFVTNNTTGGYAITFKTLAGTGISVPNGQRAVVYCNGTDVLGGLTALDSLSLNGSLTLVGGTANGVLYLNGSKAVTSGSALTFNGTNLGVGVTSPSQKLDILGGIAVRAATSGSNQDIIALRALNSDNTAYANAIYYANSHRWAYAGATEGMRLDASGNLGLGVTPSAWSTLKGFDISSGGALFGYTAQVGLANNAYFDGSWRYKNTDAAAFFRANALGFEWHTAPSGTAGNAISFTQAMTLDASGNLGIGVTPSAWLGAGYIDFPGNGYVGNAASYSGNTLSTGLNAYYGTGNWRYKQSSLAASRFDHTNGAFAWFTAPSGTAGNAISFTQAMTLDASGNLGIGSNSPGAKLDVVGNIRALGGASQTLDIGTVTGVSYVQSYGAAGVATPLVFYTGTNERARIDSSGNLGIGKTPSLTQLQVKQSTTYAFGIDNSNETQNYSWRVDTGAGNPLILGTRTTFTDLLWLSAAGNLGLGVTPSAWNSGLRAIQVGYSASIDSPTSVANTRWSNNAFVDSGGGFKYINTAVAQVYEQDNNGKHIWYTAPSGTAGNAISFTQAMTLDAAGRLFVGTTSGGAGFNLSSGASQWFGMGAASTSASYGCFYKGGTTTGVGYLGTDGGGIVGGGSGDNFGIRAENALLFMSGAAERARLDSSGNLGIGTSAPSFTLDISTAAPRIRQTATTGTNSSLIQLVNTGGTAYIGLDSSSGGVSTAYSLNLYHSGAYPIVFSTNATERMRLDSSGNLGIGTSSPIAITGTTVDVAGASGASQRWRNNAGTSSAYLEVAAGVTNFGNAVSTPLAFVTAATERMRLDTSGNLGIGTTSPDVFSRGDTRTVGVSSSGTSSIGINAATGNAASLYVGVNGTRSGQIVGSSAGLEVIAGSSLPLSLGANFSTRVTISSAGDVGVGTTSPTSTLHVSGSFSRGVPVTKTSNFTLAATENWVIVDNSTSSVTATLPAPSSFPGRELMFVARYATGGGNLVSASSNVVQPDGTVTAVIIPYDVAGRYKFSTIVSDGTNWVVMNRGIM